MYQIRNHEELYFALLVIHLTEKEFSKQSPEEIKMRADALVDWKREARKFLRREREAYDDQPQWVLQDGEYMITREPLPRNLTDADQAEAWFLDNEYIPLRYSAYDCTGQIFTRWYKIINRNGRFHAYHATCIDC